MIPYDVIVRDLRNGNRSGASRLDFFFRKLLVADAMRSAGLAREDAEELADDVLLTVISKIHTFTARSSAADFHSWVIVILRNRIRDFCRRRPALIQSVVSLSPEWEDRGGGNQYDEDEGAAALRVVIDRVWDTLKPWERTVLWCRACGAPYHEIQEYTGKPASTLRACFRRVQRRFGARVRRELESRKMVDL